MTLKTISAPDLTAKGVNTTSLRNLAHKIDFVNSEDFEFSAAFQDIAAHGSL
jgi:hypothetical protein